MAEFFKNLDKSNNDKTLSTQINISQSLETEAQKIDNILNEINVKMRQATDSSNVDFNDIISKLNNFKLALNEIKDGDLLNFDTVTASINNINKQFKELASTLSSSIDISQQAQSISSINQSLIELSNNIVKLKEENLNEVINFANDYSTFEFINIMNDSVADLTDSIGNLNTKVDNLKSTASNIDMSNVNIDGDLKGEIQSVINSVNNYESALEKISEQKNKVSELLSVDNVDVSASSQEIRNLINLINSLNNEVQSNFNISEKIEAEISKIGDIDPQFKELFSLIVDQLNDINKNSPLEEFKEYIKEIIGSIGELKYEIDGSNQSSFLNDMHAGLVSLLEIVQIVPKSFSDIDGAIKGVAETMDSIPSESMDEVSRATDQAQKKAEYLNRELSSTSILLTRFLDQFGSANDINFDGLLDGLKDSNSEYSKLIEMSLGQRDIPRYGANLRKTIESSRDTEQLSSDLLYELDADDSKFSRRERGQIKKSLDVEKISEESEELTRLLAFLNAGQSRINNTFAGINFNKNMSEDEKERALTRLKKEAEELLKVTEIIDGKIKTLGGSIKIFDSEQLKELPEEAQELIRKVRSTISNNTDTSRSLEKILELTDIDSSSLYDLNRKSEKLLDTLNKLDKKTKDWTKSFKDGIDSLLSPLGSLSGILGALSITALPLTMGGLIQSFNKGVQYNVSQGQMRADSLQAEYIMGADWTLDEMAGFQERADDRIFDRARELHTRTHGLVGFEEYNKYYTHLAGQVGGQYGSSPLQGVDDLTDITEQTFEMSKVYNISENTMAKAVQTFYKDLNMSARETSNVLLQLSQTAQMSNIPVEKYVQTITALADQFKNIGISGVNTTILLDNVLDRVDRPDQASGIVQGIGNALGRLGENFSMSAFTGIISGQYDDPFSALSSGLNRYVRDEEGKMVINENWAQDMTERLDTSMKMYYDMSGGNEDIARIAIQPYLGRMGFDSMSADIVTTDFLHMMANGDNGEYFNTLLDEVKDSQKSPNEIREKAGKDIETIANQVSAIQRFNAQTESAQYNLGQQIEGLDQVLEDLRKSLDSLNQSILSLTEKASGGISNFTQSKTYEGIVKPAVELAFDNPVNLALAAAGYKLTTTGIKKAGSAGWDAMVRKLTPTASTATREGAEIISREAAEVLGREGAEVVATKATKTALTEGAETGSKGIINLAKKHPVIASLLGLAVVGGTAYGAYSLGKSKTKNDLEETYDVSDLEDAQGIISGLLYQKVDDIYVLLLATLGQGGAVGIQSGQFPQVSQQVVATTQVAYPDYYQQSDSQYSIPNLDYENVEKTIEILDQKHTPQYSGKEYSQIFSDSIPDSNILLNSDGLLLGLGGVAAAQIPSRMLTQRVMNMAGGAALGTPVKAAIGETVPNVVSDVIMGAADLGSHAIKGDLVKEDYGRVGIETITNAGFSAVGSATGAMLGSMAFPGVGTVLGGLAGGFIGGMAPTFIDNATDDEGLITKAQNWIMKIFGGKSKDEIEYKRILLHDDSMDFASKQLTGMAFIEDDFSDVMVSGLSKYSDEIKKSDLTNSEIFNWGLLYTELHAVDGLTDNESAALALEIFRNEQSKNQFLDTQNAELLKAYGLDDLDELFQLQEIAMANTLEIIDVNHFRTKEFNDSMVNLINKNKMGNLSLLSADEIIEISSDEDHEYYSEANKLVDKLSPLAEKETSKKTESLIDDIIVQRRKEQEEENERYNKLNYMTNSLSLTVHDNIKDVFDNEELMPFVLSNVLDSINIDLEDGSLSEKERKDLELDREEVEKALIILTTNKEQYRQKYQEEVNSPWYKRNISTYFTNEDNWVNSRVKTDMELEGIHTIKYLDTFLENFDVDNEDTLKQLDGIISGEEYQEIENAIIMTMMLNDKKFLDSVDKDMVEKDNLEALLQEYEEHLAQTTLGSENSQQEYNDAQVQEENLKHEASIQKTNLESYTHATKLNEFDYEFDLGLSSSSSPYFNDDPNSTLEFGISLDPEDDLTKGFAYIGGPVTANRGFSAVQRAMFERQILNAKESGLTNEEIINNVYEGINEHDGQKSGVQTYVMNQDGSQQYYENYQLGLKPSHYSVNFNINKNIDEDDFVESMIEYAQTLGAEITDIRTELEETQGAVVGLQNELGFTSEIIDRSRRGEE